MTKKIGPQKLTRELQEKGLPVAGVSSSGRIDFTRDLTKAENTMFETVLSAHNPDPSFEELRLDAYMNAGITPENLIFALWKELKSGISDDADSLSILMNSIDARFQ